MGEYQIIEFCIKSVRGHACSACTSMCWCSVRSFSAMLVRRESWSIARVSQKPPIERFSRLLHLRRCRGRGRSGGGSGGLGGGGGAGETELQLQRRRLQRRRKALQMKIVEVIPARLLSLHI